MDIIIINIVAIGSSYGDDHGAAPGGEWNSVAVGIGIDGD